MDDREWIQERDRLQHHIIAAVSISKINRFVIFKGGTCLRMCWFEAYRYSEDIDFDIIADDREWIRRKDEFYDGIDDALEVASKTSGVEMWLDRSNKKPTRWKIVCLWKNQELKIGIDIKQFKDWYTTEIVSIFPRYDGIECEINAHTLESILISKFDCIAGTRAKYTDLYDILALIEEVDLDECWRVYQSMRNITSLELLETLGEKEKAMKDDYTKRLPLLGEELDAGFDDRFYNVIDILDSLME